jgi:hypothetical protein
MKGGLVLSHVSQMESELSHRKTTPFKHLRVMLGVVFEIRFWPGSVKRPYSPAWDSLACRKPIA